MNTILSILLLIALAIAIACDIIRIFQFRRTMEDAKKNAKETICRAVAKAQEDFLHEDFDKFLDDDYLFSDYFRDNFDKYL